MAVNQTSAMQITCTSTDVAKKAVETTSLNLQFSGGDLWYMSGVKVDHAGLFI